MEYLHISRQMEHGTAKPGYGTVIGNVELSDKAKDYYGKLKAKFGNMEFILVSEDMKSQVQANVAAYGNANKQVVLINEEKLEMMANDESFRKKYEGIIAMSQLKLQAAKNSLTSSGVSLKNFGMSVDTNGKATFFATVEKANSMEELMDKVSAYAYDNASILSESEKQVGQNFDFRG